MKLKKSVVVAIAAVVALSACGGNSQSSDTTERTRNAATTSDVTTVALIGVGDVIYKTTLGTPGSVTLEKVMSDTSGTSTGITGLAFDSAYNTLYWATQEGADAKLRTSMLGTESVYTLQTVTGGVPFGLSYDPSADVLGFAVIDGGSGIIYLVNSDGVVSSTTVPVVTGARGITGISGAIYGLSGTSMYRWSTSTGGGMKIEGGTGTQAWSSIVDEANAKAYYAINYDTTPTIMKANQSGAGTPATYLSTKFGVVAMAMKGDGSLVWVNGQRPMFAPPTDDSILTVVDPTDSTKSSEYTPDIAIKALSIWLVESPSTAVDPVVSGGGFLGDEYTCDDAVWEGDLPGQRLSRAPQAIRSVQWYLNDTAISGATGWTYTPEASGSLKCAVTGTNLAGSTSVESPAVTVIDTSTTTTIEPSGSGSGSGSGESTTSTTIGSSPSAPSTVTYKSISVKWSYSSAKKVLTGTFKKVSGAKTYSMTITGATKKTVKCTTSGTKVTCKAALKKGANSITVNAKNSAKAIVAQRLASKRVR
jgi:hypothetical protein